MTPDLTEGARHGRWLLLRDRDGRRLALLAHSIVAVCETEDDGCALVLGGGRVLPLPYPLATLLGWLA